VKHITFYLDFISPYAFLAFEKLPEILKGHNYCVTYKPVLFAGMLKHHGQLGPAEIAGKREWTYRQVLWLAEQQGTVLRMPQMHPFNPLQLLRLAWASAAQGSPNRYVCETIFRQVWQTGQDAASPASLQTLMDLLKPSRDLVGSEVKARLKASTEEAIEQGAFGVPTLVIDDKLFWGLDALPMLRAYLDASPWFVSGQWDKVAQVPVGTARRAARV
jgi:2-hydroxychromene-2-carboxylate isomerase